MRKYPLLVPATAKVMADDRVEYSAQIGPFRMPVSHDVFNLIDRVGTPVPASEAIPVVHTRSCCNCFAPLTPCDGPVEHFVDTGELVDGGIKHVAGNGERLIGAPEQLSRDRFAGDLQHELAV